MMNRFREAPLRILVAFALVASAVLTVVTLAILDRTGLAPAVVRAVTDWVRLVATLMMGVVASCIDIRERRIPNRLTFPTAMCLFSSAAAESVWRGSLDPIGPALLGGLAFAGAFFLLAWFGTLGLGDVKLGLIVGAALLPVVGWAGLLAAGIWAYIAAIPHAVAVLIRRRRALRSGSAAVSNRDSSELPFGPYIVLGAFAAVVISVAVTTTAPGLA